MERERLMKRDRRRGGGDGDSEGERVPETNKNGWIKDRWRKREREKHTGCQYLVIVS